MGGPDNRAKTMTLQELTELRRKTDIVSKFLQEQLAAHLETLRPVLSPERVFSKFLGAKGDHVLADRAFAQLQQNYRPFSGRPFDMPSEFDPQWLTLVGNRLTLYPWEYAHEVKTDRETKTITMASPVRWVVELHVDLLVVADETGHRRQGRAPRRAHPPVRRQRAGHAAGDQPRRGPRGAVRRSPVSAPDRATLPICPSCRSRRSHSVCPRSGRRTISSCPPPPSPGIPAFIELIDTDAAARTAGSAEDATARAGPLGSRPAALLLPHPKVHAAVPCRAAIRWSRGNSVGPSRG